MHGNHLPGTSLGAFADKHFFDDRPLAVVI
jgi:hypothetical protein